MTRIPRSALYQLTAELSPGQARLLGLLLQHESVSTIQARMEASVGNVSGTCLLLSARLELVGWQVVCDERPHRNKFSQLGRIGWYSLQQVPELEPRTPRRQPEGASA